MGLDYTRIQMRSDERRLYFLRGSLMGKFHLFAALATH